MWNLLEDISLFERPAGADGEYDGHVHLAQMVSLLGNPPPAIMMFCARCLRATSLRRSQPKIPLYQQSCSGAGKSRLPDKAE